MASDRPARRRNYDEALKAQILAECQAPGTSVAKVPVTYTAPELRISDLRQPVRFTGGLLVGHEFISELYPEAVPS